MIGEGLRLRGKVGLIVPSSQTITEPLYYRIAPAGVAFFTSRILVRGGVMADHANMEREAFRAAKELSMAGVDCIAYCCTVSGIIQGIEGDREFRARMKRETGIPVISTLSAVFEGLEALRLKNLVLISPYRESTHAAEEKFFKANGFQILRSRSMCLDPGIKYSSVTPDEIYRFCRENWDERAEGIFISCMNFNAMPCIGALEKDLGKPILSSHSATLWKILKMIRLQEPIIGYGGLLAEE
ncbi:hypothetical protein ACFL0M_03525 [Thermodesulfobacteriota bacterium]